jgi:formamidopyrimidine-DNA glycosylase
MPELPEVETTRLGLLPHVKGKTVKDLVVREPRLRWPVPDDLGRTLRGRTVRDIRRRGKYLLFDCVRAGGRDGHLLVHLGMTGTLRVLSQDAAINAAIGRHDHVDILLSDGSQVRLNDPRRFGSVLWVEGEVEAHPLLAKLGVEPLMDEFNGAYLHRASRGKSVAVKLFIMDSHVVTGVGNIYANEALFHAGIHPSRPAGRISLERYVKLAESIRSTLKRALKAGGSTIRDFRNSNGDAGYFQLDYRVYGRTGEPCKVCKTSVRHLQQGQRSTFYCPVCQR